jgi:tetratricopeptide (TPR) repeat protein
VKALYETQRRGESSGEQQNELKDIIDHYGSTAAGREAMMVLGNQLYKKGDFAGALEQFENLARKSGGSPLLKIAALHSAASTQKAMGQLEDAAKTYLSAADDAMNLNKSQSLYQAARCYEDLKQYAEAEKLYRKIIDSTEESDAKSLSEERLLWLIASGFISG